MRYLHGDSTEFSLNENFLETLSAAMDACVQLLHADAAMQYARGARTQAEDTVAGELARVEQLAVAVADAVSRYGAGEPNSATEAAAIRIAELARGVVEEAKAGIQEWRNDTVAAANAAIPDILMILSAFLVRHQLPGTSWGLQWRAGLGGNPARAQVHATTPEELNSTYEVRMPMEHLWAFPVRVSTIEKGATIQVPRKGLFGGAKMRDEALDRYYITEVIHSADKVSITLSRSAKEISEGLDLRIRTAESAGLYVTPLDQDGKAASEPIELNGASAAIASRIWDRVEATIVDLIWYRKELRVATLRGASLADHETPADIAAVIIRVLTPYVQELGAHSRSETEFTLKRDLGDGRREELFISKAELLSKLEGLQPEHRELFDAFDLDGQGRRRRSQPPLRAAR